MQLRSGCIPGGAAFERRALADAGREEQTGAAPVSYTHPQAKGLSAGRLAKEIASVAGGNGGGKPDFAMAGIRDASKIDDALNAVPGICLLYTSRCV